MLNELLKEMPRSQVLTRKVVADSFFVEPRILADEKLILSKLEIEKVDKIVMVLEHPQLQRLIEEDKITVAGIKPKTQESRLGVTNDNEGEQRILAMVRSPLEFIFTISVSLSTNDIDAFYPSELKNSLIRMEEGESNKWDLFKQYMLSGPVTYMLLYSPRGGAVEEWRRQMGATDPQQAESESIRGSWALSIRQNLVHGSSGNTSEEKITNVKKESEWLKNKLVCMRDQSDKLENHFLTEDVLREINAFNPLDTVLMTNRLFSFRRLGGESFLAAYAITSQDQEGIIHTRYIAQKAIVSVGGSESRAKERVERMLFFRDKGIKTPFFYGLKGADIFEEYILNAQSAQTAIALIKSDTASQEVRLQLLSQLTHIASVLDAYGFVPVGSFWNNMIYNGKDFYLVDTGFDLGSPYIASPNNCSKKQLLKEFSNQSFRELIEKLYIGR